MPFWVQSFLCDLSWLPYQTGFSVQAHLLINKRNRFKQKQRKYVQLFLPVRFFFFYYQEANVGPPLRLPCTNKNDTIPSSLDHVINDECRET